MKKDVIATIVHRAFPYAFIGFFLTGCIAGTPVRTQPEPGDPVANQPQPCIGDKLIGVGWSEKTKNEIWTEIVDKVNKDGSYEEIVTAQKENGKWRRFYNEKGQLIREFDLKKEKDEFVTNPPANRLNFPLFVGKQWNEIYYNSSIDGNRYQYSNTYTVTDFQKLQTKAGLFDVFRVWRANGLTGKPKRNSEIYYYSPKLKTVIKSEPSWREGYELIEYSIGNCDQK